MTKILIILLFLFHAPFVQAKSEMKQKRFTLRPYQCIFFPSKDLRQAIYHATGKPIISALDFYKEDALADVVSRCASAAERFDLDSSECFEDTGPQVLCSRIWRGYFRW
jgi:hypothetical protein